MIRSRSLPLALLTAVGALIVLVLLVTQPWGDDGYDGRLATELAPAPTGPLLEEDPGGQPSAATAATRTPTPTTASSLSAAGAAALAGTTIVVDPGHNGRNAAHRGEIARQVDAGGFLKDCNTVGASTVAGVPEHAIAWALAQALRARLEDLGAEVVLTRPHDDGWGPCVDQRGAVGQRAAADALVSIHADGADPQDHGFHVIAPAPLEGFTHRTAGPSRQLAEHLRDALVSRSGLTPSTYLGDRGVDVRSDLGTLNLSFVPAVMVEAGNLRNAADAALLTSEAGRQRVSDGLAAGLVTFLAI